MKSYDEIEKAYADMVADSKISDRLRTLLKEKRARMEQVQKEQIYGYKVNDKNLLVVDDLPAENVKFIFYKIEEYIQNPPAELVTEVMERHKGWNTELTYEEAIPLVSLSAIQEYVAEELSVKNSFSLSAHNRRKTCGQSWHGLLLIFLLMIFGGHTGIKYRQKILTRFWIGKSGYGGYRAILFTREP